MRTMVRARLLAAVCGSALAACSPAEQEAETADLVFTNGRIYTANESQPWAEAVAIRGTEIVYVGDAEGAQAISGTETDIKDLFGSLMLPALTAGDESFSRMERAILGNEPGQGTVSDAEHAGLTLTQAIRAFTVDAIEVGKRADLVIVDQNLFEIDPSEIDQTHAVMTMINGRVVRGGI